MAEKDMTEKALEAYDDVFADIVNNLLFKGKRKVLEKDLEQGRERSIYMGEKALREQERDTSKFWKKKHIRIAYFGLENETEPEDDMPFRVIGYDGAAYRDQIFYETDENGSRKKSTVRYPVITLVLYFGFRKHWDKAKTLYEVIGDQIDEDLKPYFHDYGINVFEIAYLTDEQLNGFQSDFRFVADYFVQMRRTGKYIGSKNEIKHIREVLQLLSTLTNDDRFYAVCDAQKGDYMVETISEALDEIENRGIQKGIEQGMEQGIEKGIEQGKIIAYYDMNLSTGEIAKKMQLDIQEVEAVLQNEKEERDDSGEG